MKRSLLFLPALIAISLILKAQHQHILKSPHIAIADTIWVFTPSDYSKDPAKQFPVVYLLHGWMGSYHQWNDITYCQSLADRYGFILVCPDGLIDSWYINSPAIRESQYADFFFFDLFPFIAKNYRIDPGNVFITGLSMGGHGALYLFAQKPDLFRSAGSLSGVLDLNFCRTEYRIDDYLGIKNKKSADKILNRYAVSGNIKKIAATGKKIIVSCGSSDPFLKLNDHFKKQCDAKKIDITYLITPGGHDYPYWKSAIGAHLEFFRKIVGAGH